MDDRKLPISSTPRFTVLHAFLWMLGALITVVLFVSVVHSFLPDIGRDLVSLGALSALAFVGLTGLLVSRYPAGEHLSEAIGTRRTSILALPLALAIGVVLRGPATGLRQFSQSLFQVPEKTQDVLQQMTTIVSPTHAVFMTVTMGLLVPLGEEAFYRGGVYGALRRGGTSGFGAAFVTSLGFALSHPQALLPMILVAAVLGFVRASSGSLYPGLLAHAAFNSVEALEMSTDLGVDFDLALIGQASLALCALLTVFFLIVLRSPPCRLGRVSEAKTGAIHGASE